MVRWISGLSVTVTTLDRKSVVGAAERAQWVREPAAKPHDLSSSPGTHMVDRYN